MGSDIPRHAASRVQPDGICRAKAPRRNEQHGARNHQPCPELQIGPRRPPRGRSADPPIRCGSSDSARRIAENLAPKKAGVVAFATSGDAEAGDYDDKPDIIFKAGHLPATFEDA